uniref:Uncharacterized protein n=1 Tax=Rhizophora mucronata TaxID=61149 RepID=A0A2P2IX92_RHIMU
MGNEDKHKKEVRPSTVFCKNVVAAEASSVAVNLASQTRHGVTPRSNEVHKDTEKIIICYHEPVGEGTKKKMSSIKTDA